MWYFVIGLFNLNSNLIGMKEFIHTFFKWYGIVGVGAAIIWCFWISISMHKMTRLFHCGHIIKVRDTNKIFNPKWDNSSIFSGNDIHMYISTIVGPGCIILGLVAWPRLLYVLIKAPKSFKLFDICDQPSEA